MQKILSFLDANWDQKSPLLLGFSGGPDSKALLRLLLEWGRAPIHLAHVDHGWRETSKEEAEKLKEEAYSLNLPFHMIRLQMEGAHNLEERARDERLQFFSSLFEKIPFQALLLGHHRDDLAETALKRVFEGAHLPFLGMKRVSTMCSMPLWRPLLNTSRKEILQFLEKRNLSALDDPTNRDPHYLRSRIRLEIIPFLNRSFGKNISENLAWLGQRAEELNEYLDRKIAAHPILKGPWGLCFDLKSLERIEARHLLQKYVTLPRELLEEILDLKGVDWSISNSLFVDRGWVFLLKDKPPRLGVGDLPLKEGLFQWGDWNVKVEPSLEPLPTPNWKDVWGGTFSTSSHAQAPSLGAPPLGNRFKKIWNEKKVPSFLRFQVPALFEGGEILAEFLSGKGGQTTSPSVKITFSCVASSS